MNLPLGDVDLSSLRTFVRVFETASFTRTARELGTTQPSVSRVIAQLERSLDVVLFVRTTRRVTPTDAGRAMYERCSGLLRELTDALEETSRDGNSLRGTIRLTVPGALGRKLILPATVDFLSSHVGISLDVSVTDRPLDMVEEDIDLAVRVGMPSATSFVTRVLLQSEQVMVAAPRYVRSRGKPRTLRELESHALLIRRQAGRLLYSLGKDFTAPPSSIRLVSDDVEMILRATTLGLGIAVLPAWLTSDGIASKRLVRVLANGPSIPSVPIVAAYPANRRASRRVRALVDWLHDALRSEAPASSRVR